MTDGGGQRGPRRVVIVGGGFGGLFAARALRRAPVSVTLVDRAPHHLFQPLLYQCATGILSEGQIAAPLRSVLKGHKNVQCVMAQVTGIDADGRRLSAVRPGGGLIEFGYDDLIVAAGMRQSYFGHDEFARFAPGMKTISDVLTIRRRVFGSFEMAETSDDPAERRRWLTFALVGAGPTGVELAGQLRELATKTLRAEYRNAKPEEARVLLFDGGSAPLAAFGEKLSAKVAKDLGKLGVEMHMDSIVTDVDASGLVVRDHEGATTRYDVGVVLWTAGVEAPLRRGACEGDRRRTRPGGPHPRAARPDHPRPPRDLRHRRPDEPRQTARRRGSRHAGRPVRRAPHPAPGHGTGVRQAVPLPRPGLGRLHLPWQRRHVGRAAEISGFPGWIGWLFIHIAFLTGYRNRLGAILTWWSAFTRDRRRERAFTTREVGVVPISTRRSFRPRDPASRRAHPAPATPGQSATPGDPTQAPRRTGA